MEELERSLEMYELQLGQVVNEVYNEGKGYMRHLVKTTGKHVIPEIIVADEAKCIKIWSEL